MYTKVFRSIYDGTLADNWQALVTFEQLLILADDAGVVDMTIAAIQRTTGIPIEILTAGISALESPDGGSRTPDMEGRRIVRLDDHRDWGWFLVNFAKYRQLMSRDEKREADRTRIAAQRLEEKARKINGVATCSGLSPDVAEVADVAYTEAEAEAEADLKQDQKKERAPAVACPADVDRQTWTDWLKLRKSKRAPVTRTVVRLAKVEAAKAGMPLGSFLEIWCARGSQGLQAEWLKPNERAGPSSRYPTKPSIAESFAEKTYTGTPEHELPEHLRRHLGQTPRTGTG